MAVLTLEDMIGTLEVLVFPKSYEEYRDLLSVDARVLIAGRVSIGEDPKGKLIFEKAVTFDDVPKELWLQFGSKAEYEQKFPELNEGMRTFDGSDVLVVYLKDTKQYRKLPYQYSVGVSDGALDFAESFLGKENVRVVYGKAGL